MRSILGSPGAAGPAGRSSRCPASTGTARPGEHGAAYAASTRRAWPGPAGRRRAGRRGARRSVSAARADGDRMRAGSSSWPQVWPPSPPCSRSASPTPARQRLGSRRVGAGGRRALGAAACALAAARTFARARPVWTRFAAGQAIWAITAPPTAAALPLGASTGEVSLFDIGWPRSTARCSRPRCRSTCGRGPSGAWQGVDRRPARQHRGRGHRLGRARRAHRLRRLRRAHRQRWSRS